MVVDEVCSRGGGNVTTRAAHMSSGTWLRCRSIARSSHGHGEPWGSRVAGVCQTGGEALVRLYRNMDLDLSKS